MKRTDAWMKATKDGRSLYKKPTGVILLKQRSEAMDLWNKDVGEFFEVADKREKLTRQLAAVIFS
jgi:hypothetical protein